MLKKRVDVWFYNILILLVLLSLLLLPGCRAGPNKDLILVDGEEKNISSMNITKPIDSEDAMKIVEKFCHLEVQNSPRVKAEYPNGIFGKPYPVIGKWEVPIIILYNPIHAEIDTQDGTTTCSLSFLDLS
jgi:hypothetical protein